MLGDACNTARSFIATALLDLTHTTFVATAFLPFFLLDTFIRVFVSGSQPHSCHENFIDPRPIDRTIHLWTAFHNSILLVWAVLSRLQRAVSAQDIALLCLQRSIRLAFLGVTPSFHSSEYQLEKTLFSPLLLPPHRA